VTGGHGLPRPLPRAVFGTALLVHLVVLYAPRAPATPGPVWIDKVVHLIIFAAVGVSAVWAGLPRGPVLGLLLVHAGVSEVVQGTLLPDRSGDVYDALADAVGVLLAWILLHRVVPSGDRSWLGPTVGSADPGDGSATGQP
jgi:hypothetical protein